MRRFYCFVTALSLGILALNGPISLHAQTETSDQGNYSQKEREKLESLTTIGRQITAHLREGNHLIYNCDLKAFLCVDDSGLEMCTEQSRKAKAYPEAYPNCIFMESAATLAKCTKAQMKMIDRALDSHNLGCL